MRPLVPTIDLTNWFHGSREPIANELDRACRDVGFFEVIGHGVPGNTVAAMQRETERFFALPVEVKQRYVPDRPEVNRGYAARGAEALAYSVGVVRPPDLFEAFNIGPDVVDVNDPAVMIERDRLFASNLWPAEVPGLRPALVAYMAAARSVADTLMDVFAVALDLPDGWFQAFTTHSTDTLRVNHYETHPGEPDPEPGQLGMGEHTDYGICTVLYADAVPGLQIVGPDGCWHDVMPSSPSALLVNLGDLMAQWTNDHWRSTVHRVLPPSRRSDGPAVRRSVAFFHDGNHDALIECLPTCTSPERAPRYSPVLAGEHLMAKLMAPRLHVPSTAADTTAGRLVKADDAGRHHTPPRAAIT
jgi:isopenicillin N synthase-like dioxygenase